MLRLLLSLSGLFLMITTFAQSNFATFGAYEKYGVVKVQHLEEILPPDFEVQFHADKVQHIVLAYKKLLVTVNKTTGKIDSFELAYEKPKLNSAGDFWLHTKKDGVSIALNANNMKQYNLGKNYDFIRHYDNKFLAKNAAGYERINVDQNGRRVVENIPGTEAVSLEVKEKSKHKYLTILCFYGGKYTYVYDNELNPLKVVNKQVKNQKELKAALAKYYISEREPFLSAVSSGKPEKWSLSKTENTYNYFKPRDEDVDYYLKLHSEYKYQLIYNDQLQFRFINTLNKDDSYSFDIVDSQRKALIPLKYQQKMGLSVLPLNSKPGMEIGKARIPEAFYDYLKSELKYPKLAKRKNIEGDIQISALVDDKGNLYQVKIDYGLGFGCDEEALRLLKSAPKLIPKEIITINEFNEKAIEYGHDKIKIVIPFYFKNKHRS